MSHTQTNFFYIFIYRIKQYLKPL